MRGKISFMQPEPTWKNIFGHHKFTELSIDNVKGFRLEQKARFFGNPGEYNLLNPEGKIIQQWCTKRSLPTYLLTISESPLLQYQFARDLSLASLITEHETVKISLLNSSSGRSFKFQDFEFTHKDFDSSISFRAPDSKAHQAVILASLIFSPLYFSSQ